MTQEHPRIRSLASFLVREVLRPHTHTSGRHEYYWLLVSFEAETGDYFLSVCCTLHPLKIRQLTFEQAKHQCEDLFTVISRHVYGCPGTTLPEHLRMQELDEELESFGYKTLQSSNQMGIDDYLEKLLIKAKEVITAHSFFLHR